MIVNNIEKNDKILSFSIFLFFFIQILNGSIKLIFDFSESQNSMISNLFGGIFIIYFIIKVLPIVHKRNKNVLFLTYIIFAILYFFSLLFVLKRGENTDWLFSQYILWTFAFWIPVGISTYSIIDYKILYELFYKYSFILTAILTIVFVKNLIFMTNEQSMFYSMSFSYFSLIPALFHLSRYLNYRKKIILLIALFEISMILILGSRGAIICLLSFISIKFLVSNKSGFYKVTRLLLFALSILILYFNLNNINEYLISNHDIRSRTLSYFSNNDSDMFSNRNTVWFSAIQLIKQNPIIGYGLGGDYYPMVRMSGIIDDSYTSSSAHNGFLQLMMFFGIPIGLFIGLWLFFSVFSVFRNKLFYYRELIIICFAVFIIPSTTISDGLFIKPGVAMYIFLILRYINKKTSTYFI